jgi:hypothetical protein
VQADSIVPAPYNSQDYDRYSYTRNNPLNFVDPSGHAVCFDADCNTVEHPITESPITRTGISKSPVSSHPSFDSSLGGNNEKPQTERNNHQAATPDTPPNPVGIGLGVVVTLIGVSGVAIGVGVGFEDPPVGLLLASGSLVVAVFGAEITYRSFGDLRPTSWPDSLLNNKGFKRP